MKTAKLLLCSCVLSLCIANVVCAGEILTPGAPTPPPPPPVQCIAIAGDGVSESSEYSLGASFLSGAIEVFRSLGLLGV